MFRYNKITSVDNWLTQCLEKGVQVTKTFKVKNSKDVMERIEKLRTLFTEIENKLQEDEVYTFFISHMQAVISGQTMPVLTKGIVLYKGDLTLNRAVGAGVSVYNSTSGDGELSLDNPSSAQTKIGKTLGAKDDQDYVMLKVEL